MIRTDVLAGGYCFRECFVLSLEPPTYNVLYILQISLSIRRKRDNVGKNLAIGSKLKKLGNGSYFGFDLPQMLYKVINIS
jgi:hypothetical protein